MTDRLEADKGETRWAHCPGCHFSVTGHYSGVCKSLLSTWYAEKYTMWIGFTEQSYGCRAPGMSGPPQVKSSVPPRAEGCRSIRDSSRHTGMGQERLF